MFVKHRKDHARTHDENRHVICLVCSGKSGTMIKITAALRTKLEKLISHYNYNNNHLPIVICSVCRISLYGQTVIKKQLDIFPFQKKQLIGNGKCYCNLCILARLRVTGNFAKQRILPTRKRNFQMTSGKRRKNQKLEKCNGEICCSNCFSLCQNGKSHQCTRSSRLNSVVKCVEQSFSNKEKEQLDSKLLKNVLQEKNDLNAKLSTVSLSESRGKPLTIDMKHDTPCEKSMPAAHLFGVDDFRKIQARYKCRR